MKEPGSILKLIVLYTLGAIISMFVMTAWFLGVFKPVEVSLTEKSDFVLIYKLHEGPYHKINEAIVEVENFALKNSIVCYKSFGEYIDNPAEVDQDRLRSHAGCLFDQDVEAWTDRLNNLRLPNGYQVRRVSKANYIRAFFEGSPVIGPLKVYGKVEDWAQEKKLRLQWPSFEVYKVTDKAIQTEYLFSFLPLDGTAH